MTMTAPDPMAPMLPNTELTHIAASLRNRRQRANIIAGSFLHQSIYNLVQHRAAQNAANGNNAERRQATRKDSVNLFAGFHLRREYAYHSVINGTRKSKGKIAFPDGRSKSYKGKDPIVKPEDKFEYEEVDGKKVFTMVDNEKVERDHFKEHGDTTSIQPKLRELYYVDPDEKDSEVKEEIFRAMILEEDEDLFDKIVWSDEEKEKGKHIPYWRLRSAKAKNDYIKKLKKAHPDWDWLEDIELAEAETDEYLKYTLGKNADAEEDGQDDEDDGDGDGQDDDDNGDGQDDDDNGDGQDDDDDGDRPLQYPSRRKPKTERDSMVDVEQRTATKRSTRHTEGAADTTEGAAGSSKRQRTTTTNETPAKNDKKTPASNKKTPASNKKTPASNKKTPAAASVGSGRYTRSGKGIPANIDAVMDAVDDGAEGDAEDGADGDAEDQAAEDGAEGDAGQQAVADLDGLQEEEEEDLMNLTN